MDTRQQVGKQEWFRSDSAGNSPKPCAFQCQSALEQSAAVGRVVDVPRTLIGRDVYRRTHPVRMRTMRTSCSSRCSHGCSCGLPVWPLHEAGLGNFVHGRMGFCHFGNKQKPMAALRTHGASGSETLQQTHLEAAEHCAAGRAGIEAADDRNRLSAGT